ncbi:5-oxoprolinase subunit C family protein [Geobacter argillaceus]|uniref:Allophanate hydrolase n=1 Tax=Geobacter argillaceus TaxID=345631 RepID=A0A562VNJ7_9BACT|nr:biotin-dependent carboxyltransferase family protein [Geobacter argillaceus]TWJ19351.1 allophanate hydrolase [Geobacter argillaceus]
MTSQLLVVSPGLLTTFQDLGRYGFRRFGVPRSGVLHPDLARIANALAGNGENESVLEFFLSGPSFRLESGSVRLALAGDFRIELTRNRKKSMLRSWRTITLEEGDQLQLGPVSTGKAGYVAISGGLDLKPVLESCSTYLRGGFGGMDGNRLLAGMQLPVMQGRPISDPDCYLPEAPGRETFGGPEPGHDQDDPIPIRVILGPQDDYFSDSSIATFLSSDYTISRESDRMGSRLVGPALTHREDCKPEIVSDGIVPGAIQVPGNGAPIVLLADGPTVGGYPKIATVASVDLPRIAVLVPGRRVSFRAITVEEGAELLLERRRHLAALIARIVPLRLVGGVDLERLYSSNLVSGAMDARCPPACNRQADSIAEDRR